MRFYFGAIVICAATLTASAQAPQASPPVSASAPLKPEDHLKALQAQNKELQRQLAQAIFDEGVTKAKLGQCMAQLLGPPETPAAKP